MDVAPDRPAVRGQTLPTGVGRQPETQAGWLREQPGEDAAAGEKFVQLRGFGSDPPLKQGAASQWSQRMSPQQLGRALAIAVQAFTLPLLPGLVGQQLAAELTRRAVHRPGAKQFGEGTQDTGMGQHEAQSRTRGPKNLPNERSTTSPGRWLCAAAVLGRAVHERFVHHQPTPVGRQCAAPLQQALRCDQLPGWVVRIDHQQHVQLIQRRGTLASHSSTTR